MFSCLRVSGARRLRAAWAIIALMLPAASASSGLSLWCYVRDDYLCVWLEIFIIVGNYRHVTAWFLSDQPEEDRLCDAVYDVRNERREVELLAKDNNAYDRDCNDERSKYLADLSVSHCRHSGIRNVADHQECESEHQEAQPEMPRQVAEHRLVVECALTEPVVGGERHSGRRARQTMEISLRSASLLDIEPRETNRSARNVKPDDQPL